MLQYRVLGAVSVTDDDVEVGLGGARQRRLAAALLIERNRVVSVDRLLEVVFEGEPTPSASVTLRSYVTRLRRVVERPGSGSLLSWRPPGYVLQVDDEAVDVARFEAAVTAGRTQLARGDAAVAAGVLREGLALWHGPAYAEFAEEDWARPEVQRLGELRLTAFELLADADLVCGRAGEVASDMEALAAEHPLREGFQSRLMLALYRSGRQVDALRVFQAHREVLADELGLDPTPSLAEMEGQILAHDVALLEADPHEDRLRGYRLGTRLGSGRDGTVFAARLPGVDRDIAIRVMPEELADDPELVGRFDADGRRVAALGHPAIVPLYDWWREPGAAYVVMRRMRGGSLRDRLARGPLSREELGSIVSRVGGALVTAAEAGIVHGRVVAESVLFDDAGLAHLGDFPVGSSSTRVPGNDARDLAVLVVEALSGERLSEPTLDAVPPALASVLHAALSEEQPPDMAPFVRSLLRASSEVPPATVERRANPYKGLRAFDEPDAAEFFGRDEVVEEILARLSRPDGGSRMVLVVGGSGSGKSSVVRAGLLPRVRAIGDGSGWVVATMTPGGDPFDQLAAALRDVAVVEAEGVPLELASDEDGIDRVVRRLIPARRQLLLVVDQLEELFTLCGERTQRLFLDGLTHAVSVPGSQLCAVATLRADFYDRPLRFERFARAVADATVPVAAMSASQLEAAIEGPARHVGGTVEPPLVAELIAAVLHQPAALPSLQFTLYELAERCPDGTLTLAAYRELGGVDAAIAARAETLYQSLDDGERAAIRRLFGRLVVVSADDEPTRRRALRSELGTVASGRLQVWLDDAVETWAEARLLTLDHHPESRHPTVEIAHEALLREWPRLRGWLADDREELVALGQLRDAASAWVALDRDPGALYRGTRLETALDLVEHGSHPVLPLEREFLDASRAERDRERQAELDQLERTARANRRLRRQLVALGALLVVAMVIGAVAVGQRNEATQQRRVASARELAAAATASLDVDPERGILLALEAIDRTKSSDGSVLREAEQALRDALAGSRAVGRIDGVGGTAAWSPDGTLVAAAEPDGGVHVADVATREVRRALDGHTDPVNGIAFSPDGALLGTTGEDGVARLWDLGTGEELHRYDSPEDRDALAPSFSADGSLFTASWWMEGLVRVIDARTGRVVQEIRDANVPVSSSFHPSGDRIALAQQFGSTVVVDVATGEPVLDLHDRGASAVAFSPDGASIATADEYGRGHVFAADTGRPRAELLGHHDRLTDIRWSPDSQRVVTASEDGSAKVWRVTSSGAEELFTLTAQATRSGVAAASFSPDGTRIATGSVERDATILWDVSLSGGTELATLPAVGGLSNYERSSVAFTDDGRYLLIGNADGAVEVWDARTFAGVGTLGSGRPYRSTRPEEERDEPRLSTGRLVSALDSSPDGELVAASTPDPEPHPVLDMTTTVRVWDVGTGAEVFAIPTGAYVDEVAWSPRGDLLAYSTTELADPAGTPHGWLTVVDRRGEQVARFADEEPAVQLLSIAFTPDGDQIVGTRSPMAMFERYFGELTAWDWRTGEVERRIETGAFTAAVSRSGERSASVTAEFFTASQEVEVWDVTTGAHEGTLAGHTGAVGHVAFDAAGERLASSSTDGTVRIWDVESADEVTVLRGHRGRVTSAAFSPDGTRLASISADGTVRVWALELDELIGLAEQRLTRDLTDDECRRYLHVERC